MTVARDQINFTVEQANAALPLVRRVVRDVVSRYRLLMTSHAQLQSSDLATGDRERIEVARMQASEALQELACELTEIGCELKDWEVGLVDFPGRVNDQDVCLCWKLGETRVAFWHHVDAGFAGRVPIAETEGFL